MSVELFNAIVQAVKEVGGPVVMSIGLLVLLWQQTGHLKGIRDSLDRLIVLLLKDNGDTNETRQLHSQVPAGRTVQSH